MNGHERSQRAFLAWQALFLTLTSPFCSGNDQFLSLRATCLPDKITISLQTQDPFDGLIYSRNFPSTCRVAGSQQSPVTTLIMEAERCGIQTRSHVREVDLYVQQDPIFQQVIDEQFLIQCKPGVEEGIVQYRNSKNPSQESFSRDVTVVSKFVGRSSKKPLGLLRSLIPSSVSSIFQRRMGEAAQEQPPEQPFFANLINTKLDVIADAPVWVEKPEPLERNSRYHSRSSPSPPSPSPVHVAKENSQRMGWMELELAQDDRYPRSGEVAQLVMRLKQSGSHDTMVSNCVAHSGNPHNKKSKDLTDFRGCSLDQSVMSDFQAAFNSRTGVKVVRAEFPLFRFPRENYLHIKCNILVCKKNCPVAKCQDSTFDHEPQEEFTKVSIIDKFMLETQAKIQQSMIPLQTPPLLTKQSPTLIRLQDITPETAETPATTVKEVQEPDRLTQEDIQEVQDTVVEQKLLETDDDESLLCLSPSRLALAFGLLLVVLLVALVFSCILWMRSKSFFRRSKAVPPPPLIARSAGNLAPPPGTLRRGPPLLFPNRGRMPPYIRVLQ
ncbi:hypothetical protein TCAL_05077 [Tigriopus californicus]|uniref:ZP domain-containing protein n=1 Tax=Tigriopus californicus TaxID=6832 RepID=A0A553NTV4_TIGCA|nr:uncharacterized protein LOC131888261 [Tigriopus californicus]TRY68867.1 hypothetical protein TCAL_05077 [Tigriopus californicus]|eukprot:TCALIF_05077-PA protein Name:"Protein of unknown function" AED:0.22 eAED:0.30 QI:0/-1/0/1/-1/1/1/0/552